jgi:Lysozyme like domain
MLIPSLHIGLGLGLACSVPVLTPEQLYSAARQYFPPQESVDMVAIALRESGGCPTAHYTGNPVGSEDSYGLVQINVKGNPSLLTTLGIQPTALYDPSTNFAAAAQLWNGDDANLNTAWYINKGGAYTAGYQSNLPIAQAAGMAVEPLAFSTPGAQPDLTASTSDSPGFLDSLLGTTDGQVQLAGFEVSTTALLIGGAASALLLLYLAMR